MKIVQETAIFHPYSIQIESEEEHIALKTLSNYPIVISNWLDNQNTTAERIKLVQQLLRNLYENLPT